MHLTTLLKLPPAALLGKSVSSHTLFAIQSFIINYSLQDFSHIFERLPCLGFHAAFHNGHCRRVESNLPGEVYLKAEIWILNGN